MFPLNFRNKKVIIPSITYFIILSFFIHLLLFYVLCKSYKPIVNKKGNVVTLSIEKKIVSKEVGEVTKNKKPKNIEKSTERQVTKKSVSERNKNTSKIKKNVKKLSNKKSLVSNQSNKKNEGTNKNKVNEKINIKQKWDDKDMINDEIKIDSNEEKIASVGSSVNKEMLVDDYINYVYEILKKNIYYPNLALRRGLEGTVYIEFLVTTKGEIKNIKISKSSGYKVLDEAGIKIAERCSPLKAPPKEIKLTAPIVFALKK